MPVEYRALRRFLLFFEMEKSLAHLRLMMFFRCHVLTPLLVIRLFRHPDAIAEAQPAVTLPPEALHRVHHQVDSLLLRTMDQMTAAGHVDPLNGAKQLLWGKIRDATTESIQQVKRRRLDRAAQPATSDWN